MKTKTISGYYGGSHTPSEVYIYEDGRFNWYVVHDSVNVNKTLENINDGADVEVIHDIDTFTWSKPIRSEKQLIKAVES